MIDYWSLNVSSFKKNNQKRSEKEKPEILEGKVGVVFSVFFFLINGK